MSVPVDVRDLVVVVSFMVRSLALCFRRRKLRPRRTPDLIGRHRRAASTTTTGAVSAIGTTRALSCTSAFRPCSGCGRSVSQAAYARCLDAEPVETQEDDMTSAQRIPRAEITGIFGAMAKRYSKKKLGQVPEPLGVMWHNRPVLKTFFGFSGKAEKWDACDLQLKSFAHMAAVSMVGCKFCLDSVTCRPTTRSSTWPRHARCRGGASPGCSLRWSAT